MKKFFDRIADHVLDFIISAIVSLLGTHIATRSMQIIDQLSEESTKVVSGIFLLLMVMCILVIRFFRNAFHHKYRIRKLEVIMEYRGDSVRVTDVHTVSTYRVFQSQMYTSKTWYPSEKITLKAKPKKYKIKKIREAGNKHEYYVLFPKKLSLWQRPITFKTELMGGNKSRQFENYYCYEVVCPVDKLILDIRIPADMCSASAEMKSFKVHEDEKGSKPILLSYNRGFKYEIPNPKVGYSYMIKWQWAGDERVLRNKKRV